jgi:alkanesulfonate monooxygenase SsuD/methylene tetrahydromethanopterin reductase-like flavin-dependent oxidoreductase (luciferase family)
MPRAIELGVLLPQAEYRLAGQTPRWADYQAFAAVAEAIGLDALWVVDHLLVRTPDGQPEGMWEGWSLLAALAAITRRVRLGTLVLCTAWRHPGLLAKMADTVDEISGGRLVLGLGAGNTESEFRQFGFPWERRVSRFAEAVAVVHQALRTGAVTFHGQFYQLDGALIRPRGPRPAGPPLLIGGTGPRVLDLTARYADWWNVYYSETGNRAAGIGPHLAALDAACARLGRDPASLVKTAAVLVAFPGYGPIYGVVADPLIGPPEALAEEFLAYAAAGVRHLILRLEPNTPASLARLAPVLDLLER